jgi:hypothetical protein
MTREEYARKEAEFYRKLAEPFPLAKPKNQVRATLRTSISPRLAEAIKANPQSVRVWARAADGAVIVEKLQRPTSLH